MQTLIEAFRTFLGGYKTYIAAASLILIAILAWINGDASALDTAFRIAEALGLGGLRAGITTTLKDAIVKAALAQMKAS